MLRKVTTMAVTAAMLLTAFAMIGFSCAAVDADTEAPYVTATWPSDSQTDVNLNCWIRLSFNEQMDLASVRNALAISYSGGDVPYTSQGEFYPTYGYLVTIFTTSPLQYSTEYTVSVNTEAKDLAGNPMAYPFSFQFTTLSSTDPPVVQSVYPMDGTTDVRTTTVVVLNFNEPMDHASVEDAFSFGDGVTVLGGVFSWSVGQEGMESCKFTPSNNLDYDTTHFVSLGTGAMDSNGNHMSAAFSSSFTTQSTTTAPYIIGFRPLDGATGEEIAPTVSVSFSEMMDRASVESAFSLTVNGEKAEGTFDWRSSNGQDGFTFYTTSILPYSTVCTVSITTEAKDLDGNPIIAPLTSTFTTKDDIVPPNIDPSPGVPRTYYTSGASVSETLEGWCTDIGGIASITMTLDGQDVTDACQIEEVGKYTRHVIYTPSMAPGQHYVVLTAVDTAGNQAQYTWSLNVILDNTPPTISGYIDGQKITSTTTTPTIRALFSDNGRVDGSKVLMTIDGADVTSSASFSDYGITYPTKLLTNGVHRISVTIWDTCGNTATASWTVQVSIAGNTGGADTEPPTIQPVKYTYDKKSGTGYLAASYSDRGSGVNAAAVRMWVDGVEVTARCTISGSQIIYPTAALSPGSHTVRLQVADNSGNVGQIDQTIWVGSKPPKA